MPNAELDTERSHAAAPPPAGQLAVVPKNARKATIMSYDFAVEKKQDYIRVEISGKRSPDMEKALKDMMAVWSHVADTCRETNNSRVLAVFQLSGGVPIMGAYDIVSRADEFGWSRHFRLAVVDLNEESRRGNRFTETVAVNRGYQLRVFANEQVAKDWLLGAKSHT